MRSSSLPSTIRAKRNSSSSTSARCPSALAISSSDLGVDVDAIGHRLVAPDLVDEAVDELHLRVAVEVALDDALGELDRDRRRRRCAARRAPALAGASMSAWRALDDLARLLLGARLDARGATWSAACRASSMMRPASARASASCAWYCCSVCSDSALADSARSRSVRIRSSRVSIMPLTAGMPHFHMPTSSTRNASEPQMISFVSGSSGLGDSWQSSTVSPSSRSS